MKKFSKLCGTNRWVFQQDGATPYTAKISQNYCRNNLHLFLKKENWPPNSPDLNPCDYYLEILRTLQCFLEPEGIGLNPISYRDKGLKYFAYNDYISRIYRDELPIESYLSPKFESKPKEKDMFALKQWDLSEFSDDNTNFLEQSDDYADIELLNVRKCGTL
ncbi:unnamed protein product [Brachionus calyciflorus]|uniref:Uncharacterized protein n=1 Tax=Brachionus calyciflorus TaxID=104777 RepID=A0A814GT55_9BILA|nr:unnamed protein product [Brachionus calyciflorus]